MSFIENSTYKNGVLMGNWFEDKVGKFASQRDGNKDTTYQKDYRKRVTPFRDDKLMCQMREKALVIA